MAKLPRKPRKPVLAEKRNGKGSFVSSGHPESGEHLGGRFEGDVYANVFTVRKKGKRRLRNLFRRKIREREIELAEKVFKEPFRNLERQFKIVNELKELNRKKKLGLRFPPTFRLLRREGKQTLLITRYHRTERDGLREFGELNETQKKQYLEDTERQSLILYQEGWNPTQDLFKSYIDPKTKKCVALLLDFGNLMKRER